MDRCFAQHPNRGNPYARSLLLGELSSEPPPPQAQDIRLVPADASTFLENEPDASFEGFTLSNILDGADDAYRQRLFCRSQTRRRSWNRRRASELWGDRRHRPGQSRRRCSGHALGQRSRQTSCGSLTPTPEAQARSWSWSSWWSNSQKTSKRSKGNEGRWASKAGSAVPELDPSAAGSAMVLLLGGMALVASRRREDDLA